jgi:glycosyltransferase involved in cell wall biosynthesis
MKKSINVLQFTCPDGFYGAERWILALAKNLDGEIINCGLAITVEPNSENQEVAQHYRALGKEVIEVGMNSRFDITVIYKLCKLVKSKKIDIIHSHGYKSDILGLIVARLSGIRALTTPHGFVDVSDWKLRIYYNVGNKFFKWFDVVAPLSEQLCLDVEGFGVAKKKIKYIRNGVDLDEVETIRTDAECTLKKDIGVKRVGFIGQITRRKNVFDILDVFETLHRKYGKLELVLLGDGEQREELQNYANNLNSGLSIKFLGFQDNRLEWLKTFDIFVITSTLEGIPRCLMEAMAMGVPVAAYDIPGVDQLITHGDTGLLAPLGDKQELSDCWEKILYNENYAKEISESARSNVHEKFSGKRMAQDYTDLFQEMVANV